MRSIRAVPTSVLTAGLAVVLALAPIGPAAAAPAGVPAAPAVVSLFPSDDLTVFDAGQRTGRRVALPLPDCATHPTDCNTVALLNQLDGFDLDPRLALRFDRPVDTARVAALVTISAVDSTWSTGVNRVVYDAATNTVFAHPVDQLAPGSRFQLRVGGSKPAQTDFTTMSATDGLRDMRQQLDSGRAFAAAGIPPGARRLRVDATVPAAGTSLTYNADLGSSLLPIPVPDLSQLGAGSYVFGSYLAPSWLTADQVIPQTPTADPGPVVQGRAQLPFVLILPAGTAPAGGWPVAVFGHGFTRWNADLFLAATQNASRGFATVATDIVGHGFGPASTWQITRDGTTTTVPAYGRGVDLNGDGTITEAEGVSTLPQPAPFAQVGSRDGLRQAAADIATLVRAIALGADLDSDGDFDLRRLGTDYYGQSFGGIYGTMLAGIDPLLDAIGLNVPGGPVSEIARLSPSFRLLVTEALAGAQPPLLNGGRYGFTESLPLAGDPPVLDPAPGALPIQQFLAEQTWLNRPGSPETFAPLVPDARVLVQVARGDETVPNPTTRTLVLAGGLTPRTSLYRNDLTPQRTLNPHGFLLDPTFVLGFTAGQTQMSTFLASGGTTIIDPDGPGPVWELGSDEMGPADDG
ncbi:MAG: hypothetical protein ACR2JK_18045 [Geodermatophilaceae bacterium]